MKQNHEAMREKNVGELGAADDADDLPRITKEDMLAHPRSMEFNIALHEMQERLFAGQPMDDHAYELTS